MDILDLLTRSGTYVLGIAIFIVTFFTRRVVELLVPSWKKKTGSDGAVKYYTVLGKWWNEVILYAVPVVYGALFALIDSDFFFDEIDGRGARALFSIVVAWFSSLMYKIVKKAMHAKFGVESRDEPSSDGDHP